MAWPLSCRSCLALFFTTLFVRWARAPCPGVSTRSPLLAEAALLITFGFIGHVFAGGRVLGTVMLLCFTMGLQNAIITKLSNSVIRTTHVTGMVTDIGIALGRVVSSSSQGSAVDLAQEFATLRLLISLVALFFMGGVTGALGFKHAGFFFTLPLSVVLVLLAVMPVIDDLRRRVPTA